MTYSMCCQRPSSPRRLPTLVLPETAPTSGVGERRTSALHGVRLEDGVAVDQDQHVVPGCGRMPVLSAAGLPALACRISRTPGRPRRATTSAVSSVEPSSTTMTSTSG